jgi:CubicO group peptidase (beta-lactamase class C family)
MGAQQLTRLLAATVFLVLGAASSGVYAQLATGENPVEARAKEFARAVSSGDPEEFERLVADGFGPDMQKIPMPAHISVLMSYWDMSHGLDFYKLQESGPDEAVAMFRNRLTGGWNAVLFRVEQESPHRIVAVRPSIAEPPEQPARKRSDRQIARDLGALMQRLAEADAFSGTVALAKNGVMVFQGAYGQADRNFGVANRIDTKYNLGSMSKMFTAVAIAQLVERRLLSYDDPLSKFLSSFPDAESAKKIRIKHLLSHSAGLGMWWGPRYQQSAKDSFRTVDDMIKWASEDEKQIQFEPGTRFQYSNTGFVALGKVIEEATGESYYEYLRNNIFEPADMQNTGSYELDRINPNLAVGYAKTFDERGTPTFQNNLYTRPVRGGPHGGGYSTVSDLLKFSHALRSGKLLKSQNVDVLLSSKPEFGAQQYGYGFDVNEERGTAGHAGGGMGQSNNLDMFLRSGWTAIVLSNYTGSGGFEVSAPVVEKTRQLVRDREPLQRDTVPH